MAEILNFSFSNRDMDADYYSLAVHKREREGKGERNGFDLVINTIIEY